MFNAAKLLYENQYRGHRFHARFVQHAVAFHSDGKIQIGTNAAYCHTEIYIVKERKNKKEKNSNKSIRPHQWAINVFHESFVTELYGLKVQNEGLKSLQRSGTTNTRYIEYGLAYVIDHNNIMYVNSYKGTIQDPVVFYLSVTQKSPIEQKQIEFDEQQ